MYLLLIMKIIEIKDGGRGEMNAANDHNSTFSMRQIEKSRRFEFNKFIYELILRENNMSNNQRSNQLKSINVSICSF